MMGSDKVSESTLSTVEEISEVEELRNEIKAMKKEASEKQNLKQRTMVMMTLVFEFYRVFMGTMIVFTVPQKCGHNMCTLSDIVSKTGSLYYSTLGMNVLTSLLFFILYVFEVMRENTLIAYMDVNPSKGRTNDIVKMGMDTLMSDKDEKTF